MYTSTSTPTLDRIEEFAHLVGDTPLFQIKGLHKNPKVHVWAKLEWQQFGGSVKARAAYRIIHQAVQSGQLHPNKILLDATSGNTGIAYAIFCAAAGIPLTLCIPDNASKERKHLLKALGANLIFTSPLESTEGAQRVARELATTNPDKYYYADQYSNPYNWKAHYATTAPEIWTQSRTTVTHFVAGLGTGGTFTGTGRRLAEYNSDIQRVAVQPGTALHGLEGWKHLETAGAPAIFDKNVVDQWQVVGTGAAYEMMQIAARTQGLLLSPSSAANLSAAVSLADTLDEGVVVTVFADDATKYGAEVHQLFEN